MKRIVGLILVFCLVFSLFAEAMAEPKWEIVEQPKCTTTKKSVVLSIKTTGKPAPKYQWWFVNPENPDEKYSGKNLPKHFKGIKVKNAGTSKITLTKVPEELHGWYAYCHLYGNAYKMDSEMVAVQVYGLDPAPEPENPDSGSDEDEDEGKSGKQSSGDSKSADDKGDEEDDEDGDEEEEVPAKSKEFTVTANGKYLFAIDSTGNADSDEGVSSLTFTESGNVEIRSDDPFKSWTVNGIRYEPEDEVTGFKMFNLTGDTSVSLKKAVKAAASANVDESITYTVTCKGCSFTYMAKGYTSAREGEVPSGAVIYVFADNSEAAANGYVINGGAAENPGASSMQVTITEDTEIVVE